ncbi:MAG: ribonuclease D [Saprospiraceae bacterium]|nr:ribonuclease D [Saprospiraceae bacterium]
MRQPFNYTLIETPEALKSFYDENSQVEWLAIDTEFIGEKRFEVLLCLVQVASPNGFYLIDPLAISDLGLFLQLIENEQILKITHAGENDYRLLNNIFGTIPNNIFDTQLAGGFVGHGYPASYGKLVEKELNVLLDKGYAATDWEARPLKKKQLEYALSDVQHLYSLYEKLRDKLLKNNRLSWVKSELTRWESPQYYDRDPHREALMNTMMQGLKTHKQVFLLRLYEWRRQEAQRLNHSKDMILPSKFIAPILRGIESGKHALLDSRIIPDRIVTQHWDTFQKLYQKKATDEELDILKRLPPLSKEDPKKDVSMDLLHGLVKYKCMESGIAPSLVLNKSDLTYAKAGEDIFNTEGNDWRREFLGEAMLKWLNERRELHVIMQDNEVILRMKDEV